MHILKIIIASHEYNIKLSSFDNVLKSVGENEGQS